MLLTALNFLAIVITCLAVGYLLGYHVRSAMEQQAQPCVEERKKKPYDMKV